MIFLYYICIIYNFFSRFCFGGGIYFSADGFAISVSLTCYVYCTICRHCNGFQNTATSVYKISYTSFLIDVSGMCLSKPHTGSNECWTLEKAACWVWEKAVFGSSEKPWEYKSYLPLMQPFCVWQSTPDPSQIFSIQKLTQHTHPQRLCYLYSVSLYVCMLLKIKFCHHLLIKPLILCTTREKGL